VLHLEYSMPASALLGLGLGVALGVAKSASSGEVTRGPQEIPRSSVVNTKIGRLGGWTAQPLQAISKIPYVSKV